MAFPSSQSFTPLASLDLRKPYVLHPNACNPAMDLVALIHTPDSDRSLKGKGKASSEGCKVALWRMTGSRVWEVDVDGGVIRGLAWGPNGLHLSLLVISHVEGDTGGCVLQHRSVHDGSLLRSTPVSQTAALSPESKKDLQDGSRWWNMEWRSGDVAWGKPKPGSSLMIIDTLPRPTPVEPPPPPITMQRSLQKPSTTSTSNPALHPKLGTFPTLLPSATQTTPDILYLSPPRSAVTHQFLTGTFPLSTNPSPSILVFAKMSEKLTTYFQIVFRGLESAQHAIGEGQKQSMIWREELETCGEQQGLSKEDVHADLFRLLMTGRGGVAVGEWLGNRLTGRTITKWETTLETSFTTIRKVITESITPALERIVLILEELVGWSECLPLHGDLTLKSDAIFHLIHIACGTIKLAEKMRQLATHELQASIEFIKWLKFETGRAARDVSQDAEASSNYDLKYTWAYMKSGFVESPFTKHFPSTADKPPKEVLPTGTVISPKKQQRDLTGVIQQTLDMLNRTSDETNASNLASPDQPDQSEYSSMAMTDEGISISEVIASPDSSDSEDTVERHKPEKEVVRELKCEPWVWVNTLLKGCEDLVGGAVQGGQGTSGSLCLDPGGGSLYAERKVEGVTWIAFVPTGRDTQTLWLLRYPSGPDASASLAVLAFNEDDKGETICLAIQFFDDQELVVLLESDTDEVTKRRLATVLYNGLEMDGTPRPQRNLGEMAAEVSDDFLRSAHMVPVHRCRSLAIPGGEDGEGGVSIALNGRKGRRVGCVSMGAGRGLEVFDMDEDEDAEDDVEDERGDEEEMSGVEEE